MRTNTKYQLKKALAFIAIPVLFIACNPTRYVPADNYLLNKVDINVKNKNIDEKDLKSYIRQKENKKIMGFLRLHLGLYNLSNINKKKGIHKYLQDVGEAPVLWDSDLSERSVKQMRLYLTKKGYYNAVVYDSVKFTRKKANVTYFIEVNQPYLIRDIAYFFEDTTVRSIVLGDTLNSKIKRGNLYDEDVLQAERIRLETMLKDSGYFAFNRDYINCLVDSALNSHRVDLELHFKASGQPVPGSNSHPQYRKYKINQVIISTESDAGLQESNTANIARKDTIVSSGIRFIYNENFWIRPGVIIQANYLFPGAEYRISDEEETKNHLLGLNVFSIVKIQFTELPPSDTSQYTYIDCQIRLTPLPIQGYTFELEGTNSSGNFGGALNWVYQHKSLFGNAENFRLKLRGAIESVENYDIEDLNTVHEYGAEASIRLPKFLLPINRPNFVKKYNPKSIISVSYNFQQQVRYTRTVANVSFGYNWKVGQSTSQSFRPIELSYVNLPWIRSDFKAIVLKTSLANVFYNHLITSSGYSYLYNSQHLRKRRDYTDFRFNAESAGNLMQLANKTFKTPRDTSFYKLFGTRYSQYVKADIDYRYLHYISEANSVAYRLFVGAGVPYGNAGSIPFEKQYFAGGANSIRGWKVLSLGPGSAKTSDTTNFADRTGDIRLEANVEYRFKMFWVLEGAMFIDAGNIWSIKSIPDREGALFQFNKFYNDIALAGGLGTRLDFGFFLFRVDVGMKMRDPSRDIGSRWFTDRRINNKDFAFSVAIGYPF